MAVYIASSTDRQVLYTGKLYLLLCSTKLINVELLLGFKPQVEFHHRKVTRECPNFL